MVLELVFLNKSVSYMKSTHRLNTMKLESCDGSFKYSHIIDHQHNLSNVLQSYRDQ